MLNQRASGVLMHISSLPGNAGIGTMGKYAFEFIDYLKKANQKYWQICPLGPTGYGDSPYQSFSTFAGNPYFIDLDILVEQEFLKKSDYENIKWSTNESYVDYGILYTQRHKIFSIVQKNFIKNIPCDFEEFCQKNNFWLEDYSLFMAIKDAHNGDSFNLWNDDIRKHEANVVKQWQQKEKDRILYYKMLQYFFFNQWHCLKTYANKNGIEIIGDVPIYVAQDSADAWSNPLQFMLDENLMPIEVAGCPPDAFTSDGQLWGNPVYNWEYMKSTDYAWWKKRLEKSFEIYDIVRIDHFRGFDSYYCIPYGAQNAKQGIWRQGPGIDLFNSIKKQFGGVPIIAEDLGLLTESVKELLKESGFPGMKVLQFAFDSRQTSEYIPYRYIQNSVVYTGTHDNDTILGWTETASSVAVKSAKEYFRVKDSRQIVSEMMIAALSSVSNTCILTIQDLIGLGKEARMNYPSSVGNNWQWRALKSQISDKTMEFLAFYTKLYGRATSELD